MELTNKKKQIKMETQTNNIELENNVYGMVRTMSEEDRAKATENRTVTFVASTDSKDRHGAVLNQRNWDIENFNRNPIIGYQHNVYGGNMCIAPNPDSQLGTAKAYFSNDSKALDTQKELLVDITFEPEDINPLAEKIFKKVMHGTLRAVSVGFIPLLDENGKEGKFGRKQEDKTVDEDTFFFFGQQLLEISLVNIPSNPDALKRSFRADTSNALTYLTKALDCRYSDIEEMKVRDILDVLDGKKEIPKSEPKKEEEIKEVKDNLNLHKKKLLLKSKTLEKTN